MTTEKGSVNIPRYPVFMSGNKTISTTASEPQTGSGCQRGVQQSHKHKNAATTPVAAAHKRYGLLLK